MYTYYKIVNGLCHFPKVSSRAQFIHSERFARSHLYTTPTLCTQVLTSTHLSHTSVCSTQLEWNYMQKSMQVSASSLLIFKRLLHRHPSCLCQVTYICVCLLFLYLRISTHHKLAVLVLIHYRLQVICRCIYQICYLKFLVCMYFI